MLKKFLTLFCGSIIALAAMISTAQTIQQSNPAGAHVALTSPGGGGSEPAKFEILITGGKIVDGTGNPWFYGDVGILAGHVVAVGDLDGSTALRTIDAKGLIVAPGFIDVHTHVDTGINRQPEAKNFIMDGVTTVVTGNCGGSVLDVGTYFQNILTTGSAINIATLVGHNSILRKVKGNHKGDLTPEQMAEAKDIVRQAMYDGAVGFSTGLIYTPGTFSSTEEIIEMMKPAAELGGIYATHMRSEATEILEAIDEALRVGREAGCRVEISHFKCPRDVIEGGSDTTLGKVYAARAAGQEVWIDQYPYTASSTGLSVMLPDFVLEDGRDKAREVLKDPEQLPKVLAEMKENNEVVRKRKDMDFAKIANSRVDQRFAGLSIMEVAQIQKMAKERGVDEKDFDWNAVPPDQWPEVTMEEQYLTIIDIQLRGGAGMVYHTMDEKDVQNIMRSPVVAVCSDSGIRTFGSGKPHPRGYGSNARVLGRYVRELGVIGLEDAIRKMTSLPALAFRFEDRGMIRQGYWADITIFNPDTVNDKATFTEPHQYSVGMEYVLVNGRIVEEHGEVTGALPGQPIYGPAHQQATIRMAGD